LYENYPCTTLVVVGGRNTCKGMKRLQATIGGNVSVLCLNPIVLKSS